MKKILIIRTSNIAVLSKLYNYLFSIYEGENIKKYMLIQRKSITEFKSQYPDTEFIGIDDVSFKYSSLKKNKELLKYIKKIGIDDVYVPSSEEHFDNFYDVFMILNKLKFKKCYVFNCYYKINIKKLNSSYIRIEKYSYKINYIVKVIIATIIIILIYAIYYPYSKIKKCI